LMRAPHVRGEREKIRFRRIFNCGRRKKSRGEQAETGNKTKLSYLAPPVTASAPGPPRDLREPYPPPGIDGQDLPGGRRRDLLQLPGAVRGGKESLPRLRFPTTHVVAGGARRGHSRRPRGARGRWWPALLVWEQEKGIGGGTWSMEAELAREQIRAGRSAEGKGEEEEAFGLQATEAGAS
jgi:hypothetical protein